MTSIGEILDELDMEDFLSYEGIDFRCTTGSSGAQLNIKECPRCGGTDWKVYLNADSGLGNCFHGTCQGQPGFNKYTFLHHLYDENKDRTRTEVTEYARRIGWQPRKPNPRSNTSLKPSIVRLPQSVALPHEQWMPPYLYQRGFDESVARYFQWRYSESGSYAAKGRNGDWEQDYSQRIIIPVFDIDGTLSTFQGRTTQADIAKRYLFPPELPGTGRFLYNAHNQSGVSSVILCEGAFDVAAAHVAIRQDASLGDVGVVGTFGKSLSGDPEFPTEQLDQISQLIQLKKAGLREVTFMWDGEAQALRDACSAARKTRQLGLKTFIAVLPPGKDPAEVSPAEVRRAFYKRMAATTSNIMRIQFGRRSA